MSILFITHGVAITNNAAGTTITHGLSRTASRLWVQVFGRGSNSNSMAVGISTVGINTVNLVAAVAGTTADVLVQEIHSIDGGPTSQT